MRATACVNCNVMLCVCVCVCEGVCVCVCVCVCEGVFGWQTKKIKLLTHQHHYFCVVGTHDVPVCLLVYVHLSVSVCVCVCVQHTCMLGYKCTCCACLRVGSHFPSHIKSIATLSF